VPSRTNEGVPSLVPKRSLLVRPTVGRLSLSPSRTSFRVFFFAPALPFLRLLVVAAPPFCKLPSRLFTLRVPFSTPAFINFELLYPLHFVSNQGVHFNVKVIHTYMEHFLLTTTSSTRRPQLTTFKETDKPNPQIK
jgi:hypothetical protein